MRVNNQRQSTDGQKCSEMLRNAQKCSEMHLVPSVRSKGDRLVSASVEIYHIAAKGQAGTNNQMLSWAELNVWRV